MHLGAVVSDAPSPFVVTHDCFTPACRGTATAYDVEQQRGGEVIFSGAMQIWWTNENSDHNDVAAFGRRSKNPQDAQFRIGDVIVVPLLPPLPPPPPPPSPPPAPPAAAHGDLGRARGGACSGGACRCFGRLSAAAR